MRHSAFNAGRTYGNCRLLTDSKPHSDANASYGSNPTSAATSSAATATSFAASASAATTTASAPRSERASL